MGIHGLTLAIADDLGPQGIRANCLLVEMVHAPRLERFGEAARERRRLAVPLKTEGTPWDVAWLGARLSTSASSYPHCPYAHFRPASLRASTTWTQPGHRCQESGSYCSLNTKTPVSTQPLSLSTSRDDSSTPTWT